MSGDVNLTLPALKAPAEGSRRAGLLLIAIALAVVFGALYPTFRTHSNATAILLDVSALAIAGIGSTALLVSGNVDLSIGSQWAFTSVVLGILLHNVGNSAVAIVLILLIGLGIGVLHGTLVQLLTISPLIVTLAMNLVWGGLAFAVTGGDQVFGFSDAFVSLGTDRVIGIPIPVIVAAVIFAVGGAYLVGSVGGLRVYSIGGNAEAARRVGVPVGRTIVALYAINSVLIAVVAILETAQVNSATPQNGATFAFDVLTAVVLGGVAFNGGSGYPIGVLIGIVTLGILNAGLVFAGFASWYQTVVSGGVLLLALAADQLLGATGGVRQLWRRGRADAVEREDADAEPVLVAARERRREAPAFGEPVLVCDRVSLSYGAVTAVREVSLSVRAGEIVCLVGDNGAGKSSVVKMISGAIRPTSGAITLNGEALPVGDPRGMRQAGIETVFQDLAVCTNLSAVHNLCLGDEPRRARWGRLGIRDDRQAGRRAVERLARLGVNLPDPHRSVQHLSGGQRQAVAIARVLKAGTQVVVLDEPTAALGVRQTGMVLDLVRSVADDGNAVVLISHDIETVLAIADRVVVLRRGAVVHDGPTSDLDESQLVHLMAGMGHLVGAAS